MSIINNGLLLASGADAAVGYQISRSLRFNSADSAYLSRTPGSAGSRTTWTWSAWIKRSKLGTFQEIWGAYTGTGNDEGLFYATFESDDKLYIYGWSSTFRKTTQVFRDVSAWYHIVIVADVTNGTANNRLRIYVNGTEITTFDTITNPASTSQFAINSASAHYIGADPYSPSSRKGDYMLADVYLLDGTATTPSTFAETDAVTGQWVPKTPTGISYGTNGFRLTFSDNSGTTSTTLGKDAAGSNNWTPNNFSVASGSGNDSLVDSPTSYGTGNSGGDVRGNYATLNPLQNPSGDTFSNGNLDVVTNSANYGTHTSTIATPLNGKWYAEITQASANPYTAVGLVASNSNFTATSWIGALNGVSYLGFNGNKYIDAVSSSYGATFGNGDVIGIAYDADNSTVTFYKNGTSQGTIGSVPLRSYYFGATDFDTTSTTYIWNFGQRQWAYAPPSGYKALVDTNLTAPTIAKPANYFDVVTYTGTGSSLTPTSTLGFGPEFIWIKGRSGATDHALYDAVRGVEKRLESNNTDAEVTSDGGVTAFNSAGFTVGTLAQVNTSSATYAAWCWDAASSNSTNTSGTITSTVRANATAGFSIVTFTTQASGSGQTVGHGLGVAPSFIIQKIRNVGGSSWFIYHSSLGAGNYILFDTSASVASSAAWNSTSPTSSVWSLGSTWAGSYTAVSYCFAPVAGYSAFGSYTGNGSSDGPFVFTGFRPRWLMIKCSSLGGSGQNWIVIDTARNTSNVGDLLLRPNLSDAEATYAICDALSNGFKLRNTDNAINGSSQTYIYMALAESPFQYARAR